MATHDYNLANQDGASFRSDLNNALAAIVSNNSSSTAPATTFAHQIWVDTTASVIKQRNAANDAWIELWRIDGGFNAKTFSSNVTLNAQSDLRFADSDSSNWVAFQAPATVSSNVTWTLPSADGTADQALTTNGSGVLSWADAGGVQDNITEGNTSAEVVDTGSDGHFKVVTEGTEALRINSSQRVGIGTTSPGGKLVVGNGSAESIQFDPNDASDLGRILFFNRTTDTDNDGQIRGSSIRFNTGVTERTRIDSSGRLLVGTSSSIVGKASQQRTLQVAKAQASTSQGVGIYHFDSGGQPPNLEFGLSKNNTLGSHTAISSEDNCGSIIWSGSAGSEFEQLALIAGVSDGTPSSTSMPGRLGFFTTPSGSVNPVERMRLGSDGNLLTFSSSNGIVSGNSAAAGTSAELFLGVHSRTSTTGGGTTSFRVWTNGNVENTNNSYGSLSDAKLKENIVDASSQWDDLKALQVRNYNFKPETGHETYKQLGLIAQEAELVSPGLVSESPDRDEEGNDLGTVTKSVNYSVLYMKAVKALQEAMERIETLETANASLEARLTALENA